MNQLCPVKFLQIIFPGGICYATDPNLVLDIISKLSNPSYGNRLSKLLMAVYGH